MVISGYNVVVRFSYGDVRGCVMGTILLVKRHERTDNHVVIELLLHQDEFRRLRGEMDEVHIFSEQNANVPSKVSLRGRNDATKYFLIPRALRKRLAPQGAVSCQRIEHQGKSLFIYVVDPAGSSHRLAL